MTSTLPWRRIILHLSHIFLTEGRTFISCSFRVCGLFYIHAQPLAMFFLRTARCSPVSLRRPAFADPLRLEDKDSKRTHFANTSHNAHTVKNCTVPSHAVQFDGHHLKRYVMRPRFKSYTDNSTVTLSPGRIFM